MDASAMDEFNPAGARMIETIVNAYCANGNAVEARRGVIAALESGVNPDELLAKTKVHSERIKALPLKERRYVPGKVSYFAERRFNDDPDSHPWVYVSNDAEPEPQEKPRVTPESEERRRKEREHNERAHREDMENMRQMAERALARKAAIESGIDPGGEVVQ